ncbi:MAG: polysaccharide biosynthesis protein [Chloroflexi bacterium]|nr:polysaccharide biosynthesis protein [Chloroflexota bacterium]
MWVPRGRYLLIYDLVAIPIAVYASFILRLEAWDLGQFTYGGIGFVASAAFIVPLFLIGSHSYRQHWAFASVAEFVRLAIAVTSSVALLGLGIFLLGTEVDLFQIPRSVPLIALPTVVGVVAAPRLLLRIMLRRRPQPAPQDTTPVVVYGAGNAGAMVVQELRQNPQLKLRIIGIIDDNPRTHGLTIHGVRVLGGRGALPEVVRTGTVRKVIIAMPRAPGKEIRAIHAFCAGLGVAALTIPGMYELLDGSARVSELRPIEVTDLLRREPIETDLERVRTLLTGQIVLITGAGGSIGSELCRQIFRCQPARLILLGHGENSIFEIQGELERLGRQLSIATEIIAVIADSRDRERIDAIFARHRPVLVFHAAAHKHVPLMEQNVVEAVSNNILGTRNIVAAAAQHGVERFVMISTDKAVNPTSVMGVSKRVAELIVHETALAVGRPYVAVRFGNVLGSRGSVILTFRRQIAAGGPVTVTDPEMRRYFMTIPEAVQLVLQAGALGTPGLIFMLDMGEPVRIVDLARDMIRLSGLQEGRDIDIVFTGRRPGEKVFEELFAPNERYRPTLHQHVFIAERVEPHVGMTLDAAIAGFEAVVRANDDVAARALLQQIVPEFTGTEAISQAVPQR